MAMIGARVAGHDNNFNLLRMVAASGVLVSHAWPISYGPGTVEPLERLTGLSLGTVCVIVFFTVSGFFITASMERSAGRPWHFVRARVLRLVPGLTVVLLLTALIAGPLLSTAPAAVYWRAAPDYVIRNLTLFELRYTLPGVFETVPYETVINGSLWSLFYEVTCYGLVFLAGLAGILSRPRLALAGLGLAGLAFCALDLMPPGRAGRLIEFGLPFAMGGCAWLWRDRIPLSLPLAAGLIVLAGLALAGLGSGHPMAGLLRVLAVAYASLWAGFADAPRLRGYNHLGDYSYGMYVYAFPVQQLMVWSGTPAPGWNIAAALPLTLACAVLSWHLVENPAQRLGRRRPSGPARTGAALSDPGALRR